MTHKLGPQELEASVQKQLSNPTYREIISTKDAAKLIGVSIRTLKRWEDTGIGPSREPSGYYHRNYYRNEVVAFAAQHRALKAKRLAQRRRTE